MHELDVHQADHLINGVWPNELTKDTLNGKQRWQV